MSTVIMNGYLLEFSKLADIQEKIMEFRMKIAKKEKQLFARLHAKMIVNFIDDIYLEPNIHDYIQSKKLKESYFDIRDYVAFYVDSKVREKQKEIKITNRRNPPYDFDCNVVILPIKDKVLALLYTEKTEYRKIWERIKGVKKYYYWNNTDKPKNISEEKWEQRSADWDEALSYKGIPSLNGFTAECKNEYVWIELNDILKELPTYERRIEVRAKQHTSQTKFKELIALEKDTPTYMLVRKLSEVEDWIKSEEGQQELEENRNYMRELLVETIDKEILLMPIETLISRIVEEKEGLQ